jgi:protein TonB
MNVSALSRSHADAAKNSCRRELLGVSGALAYFRFAFTGLFPGLIAWRLLAVFVVALGHLARLVVAMFSRLRVVQIGRIAAHGPLLALDAVGMQIGAARRGPGGYLSGWMQRFCGASPNMTYRFTRSFTYSFRKAQWAFSMALLATLAACTITPPPGALETPKPVAAVAGATLDQYKARVAQHIFERNPSLVLKGTPQAMLRSLVVVAYTVDRSGRVIRSAVYRTNGDDEAEATALASLRRASPLPVPPTRLLDGNGHLELFEGWLFNDDGKFQLRSAHSPQATTID